MKKITVHIVFILLALVLPASTLAQAVNAESQRAAQKDWKKYLKQQEKAKKQAQKRARTNWKKQHQAVNQ